MVLQKLKTIITDQAGRIGSISGSRWFPSFISARLPPNRGLDPITDNQGRGLHRPADRYGSTDPGSNGLLSDVGITNTLLGFESSDGYIEKYGYTLDINNDPLVNQYLEESCGYFLQYIYGFNNNAAIRYLQIHVDTNNPAPGDKPAISILCEPSKQFYLAPNNSPGGLCIASELEFQTKINNITLGNDFAFVSSTTGDVYTASGSPDFKIHWSYRIGVGFTDGVWKIFP